MSDEVPAGQAEPVLRIVLEQAEDEVRMTDSPITTMHELLEEVLTQVHAHCKNFVDPVAAIQCADAIRALAGRIQAEPTSRTLLPVAYVPPSAGAASAAMSANGMDRLLPPRW